MDKQTITAIILSALVIFGWQYYISRKYPRDTVKQAAPAEKGAIIESVPSSPLPAGQEMPAIAGLAMPEEKEIRIETERLIVVFTSIGGCIKEIYLKDFPDNKRTGPLRLINTADYNEGTLNITKLNNMRLSGINFLITNQDESEVEFSAKIADDLSVKKRYQFHNSSHIIELQIDLVNGSLNDKKVEYSIIATSNITVDSDADKRFAQIVAQMDGKVFHDRGKRGEGRRYPGNGKRADISWSGAQNKYFSVIVKPEIPAIGLINKTTEKDNLLTEMQIGASAIGSGSILTHNFALYAGLTDARLMKPYGIEGAADYGAFWDIGKGLVSAMRFFHNIFKNWGIAIIILSVLINLLVFPLTKHSYTAMKKMQLLQPHMEKLREEHKSNPTRLNKETMELYKKHNVNPMGGCLPMLLQIPIFFALYKALLRSIELRGAGFLWIRDLSMPDALPLPAKMPFVGSTINILPILMTGAMFFQQKVSTAANIAQTEQQRQQQQMMQVFMPLFMGFIFYSFPSGLVLYWLINTVLTTAEQRAVMKCP